VAVVLIARCPSGAVMVMTRQRTQPYTSAWIPFQRIAAGHAAERKGHYRNPRQSLLGNPGPKSRVNGV